VKSQFAECWRFNGLQTGAATHIFTYFLTSFVKKVTAWRRSSHCINVTTRHERLCLCNADWTKHFCKSCHFSEIWMFRYKQVIRKLDFCTYIIISRAIFKNKITKSQLAHDFLDYTLLDSDPHWTKTEYSRSTLSVAYPHPQILSANNLCESFNFSIRFKERELTR
jgi:hypothetical protein